jgi:uncharacterized protein (DUF952 family)
MAPIFHLAEAKRWQAAISRRQLYYPPTFDQDGLTHAAPTIEALVKVANQFYQRLAGPWLVLTMDPEHLIELGVDLRFEAASKVGDQGHHYLIFMGVFRRKWCCVKIQCPRLHRGNFRFLT